MKRIIWILLVILLLLSGCSHGEKETAVPDQPVESQPQQVDKELSESTSQTPSSEEAVPEEEYPRADPPPAVSVPELPQDPNDRSKEADIICAEYIPGIRYEGREYLPSVRPSEAEAFKGEYLGADEYGTWKNYYAVRGMDTKMFLYGEPVSEKASDEILVAQWKEFTNHSPWEYLTWGTEITALQVRQKGGEWEAVEEKALSQWLSVLETLRQGELWSFERLSDFWKVDYPQQFDVCEVSFVAENGLPVRFSVSDREFVTFYGRSFCVRLSETQHTALLDLIENM